MDRKSRDYVICLCDKITRGQVEDIIRETGIRDLKELCEVTRIGTKCGGCREDLQMLLNDIYGEN